MAKLLTNEQFDDVMQLRSDAAANSGFTNTKTQTLDGDSDLWLKITGLTVSSWDASQYVYTAAVYVTPFASAPLVAEVKAINVAECAPSKSVPLGKNEWHKAVGYLNKASAWYHVVDIVRTHSVVYLDTHPGGDAGSLTTACTFTYNVYWDEAKSKLLLSDVTSAMTRRTEKGKFKEAKTGVLGVVGTAIKLIDCDEVPDVGPCGTG